MNNTEWIFPKHIDQSVCDTHYGFVYLITNTQTGRMYVGRKYFTAKKGKRRVQSDWRSYWGSCKPLLDEIAQIGKSHFKREILSVHMKRGEVNYAEVEEQIKRDVLTALMPDGSRAYYNGNIMNRWFSPKETITRSKPAHNKGVPISDEARERLRATKRSKSKKYTYQGKDITIPDICLMTGFSREMVHYRLKHGWTVDEVINTPPHTSNRTAGGGGLMKQYAYAGSLYTIPELAKMFPIRADAFRYRLRKGWTVDRIISHYLSKSQP